ncbi:MAG: hypothetical protein AAGE94_20185, partial [Acidobacteriota bacterium]
MSSLPVGRRRIVGLGPEPSLGRGHPTNVLLFDPVLPSGGRLRPALITSPAVSRTGHTPAGVAGSRGGDFPFQLPLSASQLLDDWHQLYGHVTKTAVPGGWHYRFDDSITDPPSRSAVAFVASPPLEYHLLTGILWSQAVVAVAEGQVSTVTLTGGASNSSGHSPAEVQIGNTGAARPSLRGTAADLAAGDLWIEITRDVAGGLRFRAEQSTDETPVLAGIEYDAVLVTGAHVWQNVRGATGLDIGRIDERHKDGVDILFGTAAELAQYA